MAKIKMKTSGTIKEHFETFILSKQAEGVTAKTLTTYRQHLSAVSKYLNIDMAIDALAKSDLDKMIGDMREGTLSPNSISSYRAAGGVRESGPGARSSRPGSFCVFSVL